MYNQDIGKQVAKVFALSYRQESKCFHNREKPIKQYFMAQQVVRGYGRFTLSSRCAIKIDIQKVFDTLNWKFILDVMTVLRILFVFISWIRSCLTTSMFSISFNGGLIGYFKREKGVRQGIFNPLISLLQPWISCLNFWMQQLFMGCLVTIQSVREFNLHICYLLMI